MPLLLLKLMAQLRRGETHSRCALASSIFVTPRLDWAIGLKGGKGTRSWIDLGIALTIRCIYTSRIWITPHLDWAISFKDLDDLDDLNHKHKNVPTDKGYTKIYSNASVFSAVKPDGSIW
jgi:hypothetical protein